MPSTSSRLALVTGLIVLGLAMGCLSDDPASLEPADANETNTSLEVTANDTFEAQTPATAGGPLVGGPRVDAGTLSPPEEASLARVTLTGDTATVDAVEFLLCAGACGEGETRVEAHGSLPIEVSTLVPAEAPIGWEVRVDQGAAADQTFEGKVEYLEGQLPDANASDPGPAVRFDAAHEAIGEPSDPLSSTYRLTGFEGAEPNLGVDSEGRIFATAHDRVIRSTDGGESFEQVWKFAPQDDEFGGDGFVSNNDPMLWLDETTDRVFADPMWPVLACSYLAFSDDGGESWTERPGVCHPPPMDHQKLSGGPPGPQAPPVAGQAYPNVLYQCYNQVTSTACAVSYDGGVDWAVHQVANHPGQDECYGVNGKVALGPEGVAYLPLAEGCENPALAVSTDSGLTWTLRELPSGPTGENDPDVEVGPEGTVYLLYHAGDFTFELARSTDRGQSWEGPWTVTPPGTTAAAFPALEVGPEGRPAMAFLTTSDPVDTPSTAPPNATWHLQVVAVEDPDSSSLTFTARQVTQPSDPVQEGCIWLGGFPGEPCRNLLDFIDAQAGPTGDFHIAYTEGCLHACAINPYAEGPNSRDNEIALATIDDVFAKRPAEG